jgi:tRNA(Ile)-lysidine synthetase-like protein
MEPRLARLCLRQICSQRPALGLQSQRLCASDWQRLAQFAAEAGSGRSMPIPGGGWLRVGRRELEIEWESPPPQNPRLELASLPAPQAVLNLGERTAYFDADLLRFPLRLRALQPGDRMRPALAGTRRRLVDILREGGVPSWRRAGSLVLEDADRILWAVGHVVDPTSSPTGRTERVLRATIAARPG